MLKLVICLRSWQKASMIFCNERKSLDHWLLDILDFVLYNRTSPLEGSYLKITVLLPEQSFSKSHSSIPANILIVLDVFHRKINAIL